MQYTRRVLIVSAEPEYSAAVERHLRAEGFQVEVMGSTDDARHRLQLNGTEKEAYDLILVHSVDRTRDDLCFVEWLHQVHSRISVILVSYYGLSDECVGQLRPYLDDYDSVPVIPERMMELIDAVERKRRCYWLHLQEMPGLLGKKTGEVVERRPAVSGGKAHLSE